MRLCLWTAACSAYAVLLLGGSVFFHIVHATEDRSAVEHLAAVTQQLEQDNRAMLELRKELAEATTALEVVRAIREQPNWSRLFLGVSGRMGDEIVLSRCQLATFGSDDRLVTEGGSESAAQPLTEFLTGCRHRLLLTGFGKSQESVSRFVLRLEESSVFDAVRLISSCRQTFLKGDAVAFSVECRF